ncbi:MAG: hypothetical protein KBS76_02120 [Ruminococcus sp.]|nr:hypothetical protein [Candidatus Apopatosoma intestinale]
MKRFRKSMGGYRRRDVTEYIEKLTAEQEESRREWDTQTERMRRAAEEDRQALLTAEQKADELAVELYEAEHRAAVAEAKVAELTAELAQCRKLLEEKEEIESRLKHSIMGLSGRVEQTEPVSRPVAVIHARGMRGKR